MNASNFSRREILWITGLTIVGLVVIPILNAFVPVGSAFHVSNFAITLYGKYLCYAVLAVGVNLYIRNYASTRR